MQELTCDMDHCFLCRNCIPDWKALIAVKKTTITVKKGRPLFLEGDKVEGIYFVYAGTIKVHKQWIGEKELILRFAKEGDIVGHRGLGGDAAYPVGATALEETKVCFIDNEFLEATLKTSAFFTYKLMHFYAAELQRADRRMRDLVHMEAKGRIANALLEIRDFFGVNKENYISVPITRQDIASYAGTTYETLFKFFTELARTKVLSTSGKNIRINKPDKLSRYILSPGAGHILPAK